MCIAMFRLNLRRKPWISSCGTMTRVSSHMELIKLTHDRSPVGIGWQDPADRQGVLVNLGGSHAFLVLTF